MRDAGWSRDGLRSDGASLSAAVCGIIGALAGDARCRSLARNRWTWTISTWSPPSPQEMRAYADAHDILILAHSYQEGEIQEAAHFVGDSLELARFAKEQQARNICLCGVHFMAETAKILCPAATRLRAGPKAGCSLADGCKAEDLEKYQAYLKAKLGRNDLVTICYVNCTAGVKALSRHRLHQRQRPGGRRSRCPADQPILFVPDMHLGSWLNEQTGRNMTLWNAVVHGPRGLQRRHAAGSEEAVPGSQDSGASRSARRTSATWRTWCAAQRGCCGWSSRRPARSTSSPPKPT